MIKLKDILNEIFDVSMLEDGSGIKYELYCDLDGVLVDLDTGVKRLTGGIKFDDFAKLKGYDELWTIINNQGSIWWATLPWKKDGKVLWNTIKSHKPTILTAGSTSNTGDLAVKGKKEWCYKNIGFITPVIVTDKSRDKQKYAAPNKILIDDLPLNIQQWESKGGIGILHTSAEKTIQRINEIYNR